MKCRYLLLLSIFLTACSGGAASALSDTNSWKDNCPWQGHRDLLLDARLLSGDASGLSQISRPFPATDENATITSSDALADLSCLRLFFTTTYAGVEFYKTKGIDLVARLDQLATQLSDSSGRVDGKIKIALLFDNVFDLHKDAPDAHMLYKRVVNSRDSKLTELRKSFQTQKVQALPWEFSRTSNGVLTPLDPGFSTLHLKSCRNFSLVRSLSPSRMNAGAVPTLAYSLVSQHIMKDDEEADCEQEDGSRVLISVREIKPKSFNGNDAFSFKEQSDGVIVVRMASFLDAVDEPKLKLVSLLSNKNESRPIVFDLRANHGGGNGYVEQIASALRSVNEPAKLTVMKNKLSRFSLTGFLNTLALMYLEASAESPDKQPLWHRFDDTRKGVFTWAESHLTPDQIEWSSKSSQDEVHPSREQSYKGRIILLVDKHCASECESFIEVLQDLTSVTLVGTPTNGAMHLSNPGTIVLPHSKIIARLGMAMTEYDPTIDAVEMFGHEPAIYFLDGDDDAKLELAISLAKSHANVE